MSDNFFVEDYQVKAPKKQSFTTQCNYDQDHVNIFLPWKYM